ncbi:MAG: hypothetical protein ABJH28_10285 [Paraglaciecola sp.]|uniref:hypothetical protein n=1 Tax=Paraglaciecola sp. TaxID=1920173 RepID=UPI0032649AFE
MASNKEAMHETLRRKYALLLHENAYWHAANIERSENKKFSGTIANQIYREAFDITEKALKKRLTDKEYQHESETLKKVLRGMETLRNKMTDGKLKYPYLKKLILENKDFANVRGTDEDVYEFAKKIGYCLTKDDAGYGDGCFVEDQNGEYVVDRNAVLKAIDETIWSASSQNLPHLKTYEDTESMLDKYKGVYAVYYPVITDQKKRRYFKSVLRISHVIKIGKEQGIMRAKLNMPNVKKGDKFYYQYRGKFNPLLNEAFGSFTFFMDTQSINGEIEEAKRNKVEPDSVTIMCHGMHNQEAIFSGVISSFNQREGNETDRYPYSSVVFLKKMFLDITSEIERSETEYEFMTAGIEAFDDIDQLSEHDEYMGILFSENNNSNVLKPPVL